MNRVKLLDGYTLTHEHMTIDLSDGDLGTTSFEPLVRDLKIAYDCGVRNIVDMTNQSMGRDPEYVARLMDATGINIILSTGYYLEQYIKGYVEDAAVAELSQRATNDLSQGIGNSGLFAGVIGEIDLERAQSMAGNERGGAGNRRGSFHTPQPGDSADSPGGIPDRTRYTTREDRNRSYRVLSKR